MQTVNSKMESGIQDSLFVARLDSLGAISSRQFGGKAANLGELISTGQKVPGGIALAKDALAYFLKENGVDLVAVERIHTLGMTFLESSLSAAQALQQQIIKVLREAPFPASLADRIFTELNPWLAKKLAVRSSCLVEDSKLTSFAGQYLSVLNVQGQDAILTAIRDCWASQYEGRALSYAIAHRGMPVLSPGMGIVIQEMVNAEYAGVCFTTGPTAKTLDVAIVESVRGCGEQLVSGEKTPSHYEITTKAEIRLRRVPKLETAPPTDDLVLAVAAKSRSVADYFGCPQDIEWAAIGGEIFLLQARPITVTGNQHRGAPVGLPGSPKTSASKKSVESATSPHLVLRDDLHEWLLTTCDPFIFRGASYLLSNQHKDGAWRIEGHPEWDEASTAMVVQMLVDGGIPATLQWQGSGNEENAGELGIPKAIHFLAQRVAQNGCWGSDLWDTCQVLRALHCCGVPHTEPLLQRPLHFIQGELNQSLNASKEQEWFGAGFLAVALRMFSEFGLTADAIQCLQLLLTCQDLSGDFYGPNADKGGTKVPSEWHTAQAVSALARCAGDNSEAKRAVDAACAWLLSRQQTNGAWGVSYEPYLSYNTFFTAYCMIALLDANRSKDVVMKAYKWLRGQQKASAGFGDLGSSLMAMSAFQSLKGTVFTLAIPIPVFARIQSTLSNNQTILSTAKK
jgi:pyruvate,water dikinase